METGDHFPCPHRRRDLAHRTGGQAVGHCGGRGRARSGGDHGPAHTGCRDERPHGGRRCLGQNLSGGPGPRRSVGTTEDCPALPWLAGAMKRFCIWSRAHGSGCDGSPLALPEGELTPAAQLSFAKRSEPPYCIRRVLRKVFRRIVACSAPDAHAAQRLAMGGNGSGPHSRVSTRRFLATEFVN
jgi:hypothetical protein